MTYPPILQEYRADLVIYCAAAIVSLFYWRRPTWPRGWTVAACCFRIAGWWISAGEAWMYFKAQRADNSAKALERAEVI